MHSFESWAGIPTDVIASVVFTFISGSEREVFLSCKAILCEYTKRVSLELEAVKARLSALGVGVSHIAGVDEFGSNLTATFVTIQILLMREIMILLTRLGLKVNQAGEVRVIREKIDGMRSFCDSVMSEKARAVLSLRFSSFGILPDNLKGLSVGNKMAKHFGELLDERLTGLARR